MTADVTLPPELEAIVLAVLETRVKEHKAAARAGIERLYNDGDKRVIRSPLDDAKLGSVCRTSPDPTWRIVDRDALAAHLADPDNLEYVDDIAGSHEQVLAVLAQHAPHLLARVERVRPELFDVALAAAASGEEVAPGIARVKPRGNLVVRPDKGAAAAVERMVDAGVISWDGTQALPASEAVEEARHAALVADARVRAQHMQGMRYPAGVPGGSWGCACGWVQDKPHAEHVEDMVAAAHAEADVPERVRDAEARREVRDLIDRSSLGEHVREVGASGFAQCRCGRWATGSWEDHLGDEATEDMRRSQ